MCLPLLPCCRSPAPSSRRRACATAASNVGGDGAKALSEMLKVNTALKTLGLEGALASPCPGIGAVTARPLSLAPLPASACS